MTKEEQLLSKRFLELADICYQREIPLYSDFLNLNEQTIFHSLIRQYPPVTYHLFGGYNSAERKIVCFFPSYFNEDPLWDAPISILKIVPVNHRFSDNLTHRDYLGAILNLGIQRSKIGDILIVEEGCYVMCLSPMEEYLSDHLLTIKHTSVSCTQEVLRDFSVIQKYESIEGSVASIRLDNILSLVYHTSRSKIVPFIEGEKVFVNGKLTNSNSFLLSEGDIVSVRGLGKFLYVGVQSQTKKGRYFISVKKYC